MRKIAFAPLVDADSEILLLGTMPSEESLRKGEYYGHKSNQFWKILFQLFETPFSTNYDDRKNLVASNKIAIWDVLASCKGTGSADSDIKEEQPNDFGLFFSCYTNIQYVFFTSQKSEEFYKKYVGINRFDKSYHVLPSPSPANARMSFEKKLEAWKVILTLTKS